MGVDFKAIPVLATRGVVLFPNTILHLDVSRGFSVAAVNFAAKGARYVFVVSQQDAAAESIDVLKLNRVGTIGIIKEVVRLPNDSDLHVVVHGVCRAEIVDYSVAGPFITADIAKLPITESKASPIKLDAMLRSIKGQLNELVAKDNRLSSDSVLPMMMESDLYTLCNHVGYFVPLDWKIKQQLLEISSVYKLAEKLLSALKYENEIAECDRKIAQKIQLSMDQSKRDYYLREKIKAIKDELGECYDDYDDIAEYKEKIDALYANEDVKTKLYSELEKLAKMPQGSHEATVLYNYLDVCTQLPWDRMYIGAEIDIEDAKKILDKHHYGMDKVKQCILEEIAVRKLTDLNRSQILCLVGPPGVGKTSIASAVAECMGRKFQRISLGGIKDESEIRGHRRTYIGAMAGRIISAVKTAGCSNPLILLDEIDKIGSDFKGDCSASLLEALDPEQNHSFHDHYIDMPYDLSKVLFITTANDPSSIPGPLRDRMELIELPSYTREDKFNIAKKHLISKQIKLNGLDFKKVRFNDSAIYDIIDHYTREGGVRELERKIIAVFRKIAYSTVSGVSDKFSIKSSNIEDYLGPRKYKNPFDDIVKDEVGVVNGLAWSAVGGEVMKLEAAALSGTGKIVLTGSLGDVMQESAKTAISYVRSIAEKYGIDKNFYKNIDLHIHATEAAVPKDGPSAGITMAVAIVSALTGIAVKGSVAMTGEISLRGRVMPIGGLKEKSMAAYKAGIKTVIIPEGNKSDLSELDKVVRENIDFVVCDNVQKVLDTALVK